MVEQVDVVVIGLGVSGEEVAGRLAEAGLSVVGVESALVGGECAYWACIPTKMMVHAARLVADARQIDGTAGHAEVRPDWGAVHARIRDDATDDWDDTVAVERLVDKGARFVRGRARLVGPHTVEVGEELFEARRGIVIATGTQPAVPPIPGLADTPFWTNRTAVEAKELPTSIAIIGGGSVGVEFAQVYARFGAHVTVLEASDRLLDNEEPEASELVERSLHADAVAIHTGVKVDGVHHDADGFLLTVGNGAAVEADRLLVATGRRVDLESLGVAASGLDPDAREIRVDERMRAGDRLWAVGDVTGQAAFTHVAMYQAGIAIRDILGADGPPADYHALPRVTFTDPEVGAVGLTEAQARDQGMAVAAGYTPLDRSTRGWIDRADGFVKLVADRDRNVLVGATSAGPAGGEVLAGLAVAVQTRVPLADLRHMIYAYPTYHRAVEAALADLGAH